MTEHFPIMCESLGLIPRAGKNERKKRCEEGKMII